MVRMVLCHQAKGTEPDCHCCGRRWAPIEAPSGKNLVDVLLTLCHGDTLAYHKCSLEDCASEIIFGKTIACQN